MRRIRDRDPAAWVFPTGHRIRIDISNADSAAQDPPSIHHYGTRMGSDTYHHDQARSSRLMLPIPPPDACIGEPTPRVQRWTRHGNATDAP